MTTGRVPSAVILNVGRDPALLASREMLLRSAGHSVESACFVEKAFRRIEEGDLDLILLCHSMPEKERQRIFRLIRSSGSPIPVMLVAATLTPPPDDSADFTVESTPAVLLRRVSEIFQMNRGARSDSKKPAVVDK